METPGTLAVRESVEMVCRLFQILPHDIRSSGGHGMGATPQLNNGQVEGRSASIKKVLDLAQGPLRKEPHQALSEW